MSKREEFIAFINAFKTASPTITNEQRKGFLRMAVQQHGLAVNEATEILDASGLVIGEGESYFEVLSLSISDIKNQSESVIVDRVAAAHKELYTASLRAGGRPRADGRTEEQWRRILNQARDTLTDPQKRLAHLATLQYEDSYSSIQKETTSADIKNMVLIPAGEFEMGSNDEEAFSDEHPRHNVFLDAYYIDKYPVTNAQYKIFIDEKPTVE